MTAMLRRVCLWCFLVGAVTPVFTQPAPAVDSFDSLFPCAGLDDRVDFWKMIFTRYGRNDVLLHDRNDLRLVYTVVTIPDGATPRMQRQRLRAEERRLIQAFDELVSIGPDSEQPNPAQTKILDALKRAGLAPDPALLRKLRDNIHCQRGIREKFQDGLVRSGRYLPEMEKIFVARGLPRELALLPHVESSFDYAAFSNKGAAGIWQITRGTGKGRLKIGRYVDERLDPLKAAEAAASLLRENYQELGNWPLAITAYNQGKNGMLRAQAVLGSDIKKVVENYQSRIFGFAGQNFYAEFLAAVQIARNYEEHFPSLQLDSPLDFETVSLTSRATSRQLAARFGVTEATLRTYNPHLTRYFWWRSGIAPAGTTLRVPVGKIQSLAENVKPQDPLEQESRLTRYKVRRGDTLLKIARRFEIGVGELMRANRMKGARIYLGQLLLIPMGS